ncbi:MAG: hypothetical protein P4L79_10160 [Legionella sp.]|uniref:hypothetical protein n=1 Tax=Legionella sp. TaxID=459 RepID=UPI0028475BBD|nr:hypothetical protein [Legionella sp.]
MLRTVYNIDKLRIKRELNHFLVENNERLCTYEDVEKLVDAYHRDDIPFGVDDLGYDLISARQAHRLLEDHLKLPVIQR